MIDNNLEKYWNEAVEVNTNRKIESVSGIGSTLRYTEHLRSQLPEMLNKFSISKILDAPCGDMNWMSVFLKEHPEIIYIGGDIVDKLITNNQQYVTKNIQFMKLDVTLTPLPDADLWFCRDLWFHLPDEYIFKSIDNFLQSNIKYLFTSNHINTTGFKNTNLKEVDFKLIDLFSSPYNLPQPLYRITDFIGKKHPREMVLFERSQILRWRDNR